MKWRAGNLHFAIILLLYVVVPDVFAEVLDNTTIVFLAVNGGADTVVPGTTCLQISNPVASSCTNAMVAIPNNNTQLLSAALSAKASGAKIWFYYASSTPTTSFHCPGLTYTPCSVISIGIR